MLKKCGEIIEWYWNYAEGMVETGDDRFSRPAVVISWSCLGGEVGVTFGGGEVAGAGSRGLVLNKILPLYLTCRYLEHHVDYSTTMEGDAICLINPIATSSYIIG